MDLLKQVKFEVDLEGQALNEWKWKMDESISSEGSHLRHIGWKAKAMFRQQKIPILLEG